MNFSNVSDCYQNHLIVGQGYQPALRSFTTAWNQPSFLKSRRVMTVVIAVIALIGVIGNILCIFTMFRMELKRFSSKFFFCVIAVCDFISFPLNMSYLWILFTYNIVPDNHSRIVCKLFRTANQMTSMTSWWVLTFISIERFLLVFAPNRMRSSVRSQKIIASLIVLGLDVLLFSLMSFYLEFEIIDCTCTFQGSSIRNGILVGFGILSYVFISIQAISSSSILVYVLWKRSNRVAEANSSNRDSSFSLAPFQISAGIGIMQFLSTLPVALLYVQGLQNRLDNTDRGTMGFTYWTSYFIFFTTFGTNFYVSLATSRRFRQTAKDMLLNVYRSMFPKRNT